MATVVSRPVALSARNWYVKIVLPMEMEDVLIGSARDTELAADSGHWSNETDINLESKYQTLTPTIMIQ